jgi:membrane protease YdiL (CAAX protease family)
MPDAPLPIEEASLTFELALVLVAAASLTTWAVLAARWSAGKPLLRYEPRREVPWGPIGVAVALVIVGLKVGEVLQGGRSEDDLNEAAKNFEAIVLLNVVFYFSIVALLVGVLVVWHRAGLGDFGIPLTRREWLTDLKAGGVGFLASLTPILGLNFLISLWFPSTHPIIEILKHRDDQIAFALVVFQAVVVAPLFEEFIFRLLVQGWLEKIARRGATVGGDADAAPEGSGPEYGDPDDGAPKDVAPEGGAHEDGAAPVAKSPSAAAVGPIVGSAAIFAPAHLGHGLDPIPLLFFGMFLGYLYHQTHRIAPCILLHALFNGFAMVLLIL